MGGGKRNRRNAAANNKNKHQHHDKQQQQQQQQQQQHQQQQLQQLQQIHEEYNPPRQSHTTPDPLSPSSHSSTSDDSSDSDEEEIMDFCQRFFGDPLFSNMNVSLLFLTATFLPMIVWIPHFLSEYRRLRHIQILEEERQVRMQKARMDVKSNSMHQHNSIPMNTAAAGGGVGDGVVDGGGEYNTNNHDDTISQQNMDDITILQDSIGTLNSKSTIHFPDPHILNPHVHLTGSSTTGSLASTATATNNIHNNNNGMMNDGHATNNNNDDESDPQQGNIAQAIVLPTLCPDGITIGYDNWFLLRDAISEANAIAAEEFLRWNEYLVKSSAKNESDREDPNPAPVYRPPEPFVICPGVTLNQKSPYRSVFSPYYWASYLASFLPYNAMVSTSAMTSSSSSSSSSSQSGISRNRSATSLSKSPKTKLSPIFINAEDITIECDMCTVDLPGTHFSFGPHAKNVMIKGITFRGATTSSLTFHHHGADVGLEDCYWLYNSGGMVNNGNRNGGPYANVNGNEGLMSTPPGSTTTAGAVADLNSTSTVTFFRCVIDDVKQNPKRTTTGAGVANVPGMNPPAGHHVGGPMSPGNGGGVVSSSLTIRN